MHRSTQRSIEWVGKSTQQCIESEADSIPDGPYAGQLRGAPNGPVGQNYWKIYTMNQSRMKSTLAVVEQIQALRWQRQSNEVIEMKINEKMKKNGFDEQQIKDIFINA